MTTPLQTVTLDIEGMTCASCVARVEKRLTAIGGVEAQVNLATERATVTVPAGVSTADLVQAVAKAGTPPLSIPRRAPAHRPAETRPHPLRPIHRPPSRPCGPGSS